MKKLESMKQLKTFNQWMNEDFKTIAGTNKRFVAFQPDVIPHPILLAEHVWNECAQVYTLRLDSFLSQLRIIMGNDVRATAYINSFKEEMVKAMVSNSVGFTKEEGPVANVTPSPEQPLPGPSLKLV